MATGRKHSPARCPDLEGGRSNIKQEKKPLSTWPSHDFNIANQPHVVTGVANRAFHGFKGFASGPIMKRACNRFKNPICVIERMNEAKEEEKDGGEVSGEIAKEAIRLERFLFFARCRRIIGHHLFKCFW